MSTSRVEIGLYLAQVDIEETERRRAINERENAALPRELAELFGRQHVADGTGLMSEGEHACSRCDRTLRRLDVEFRPRVRVRLADDRDGVPKPLRLLRPR